MAPDSSNTSITILHLEDDPAFARKANQKLSTDDFQVEIDLVKTQKSFSDAIRNKNYDLILLDDHVPDGNGLDALKLVNEQQASSSVVMLSDLLDEGRIVECIKLGAANYLLKNNLDGLSEVVRTAINEKQNRKPEIDFQKFYQTSPDFFAVLNIKGEFVNANKAWSQLLEVPVNELTGKPFVEFVHQNYRDNALAQFNKLINDTKEPNNLTSCFLTRNGDIRWLQWNAATPTSNAIYITARDVTESKQQTINLLNEHQNLKNQIEQYKSELAKNSIVADQINDSIITTNLKGIITNWNKGSVKVFGYSYEEAMGQHISMVYPEKDYKYVQEEGGNILLEQGSRELDIQMCRKSGEVFNAKLSLSVIRDDNGEVNGMVGYAIDLGPDQTTEHPQSEPEQPSQSEQDLQQTLQKVQELELQLKDSEEMLSKAEQELQQMDQDLLTARKELQQANAPLEQKPIDVEHQVSEKVQSDSHTPQDIKVDNNENCDNLPASTNEFERANQIKSDLLSSISHELRVTLNSILGFSQVIGLDEALSEKNKQYLTEISNAGSNLLVVVAQLIDVVKLESGKHQLNRDKVNIAQLVEQCIEQVKQKAGDIFDISLKVDSPENPVFALADERRLKQVISHVIANAVKYGQDMGRFEIYTAYEENNAVIRIASPGAGKVIQDRSFESTSETLDANEQKGLTSTRIELLITQTLLDLMGGNIHYEFDPDKVLVITVPGNKTPDEETPDQHLENAATTPAEDDNQFKTVLYIEEDAANIRLVETLLTQRSNCKLVAVQSTEQLLETIKQHNPSLLLLDMNLDKIDGHELLDQLRKDGLSKNTPVVAVSTDALPEDVEKARAAGFTDYLTKPIEINNFLNMVDLLLTPPDSLPKMQQQ